MRFSLSTCLIQSFLDPDASTQASLDGCTLVLNTLGYWLLQTLGSSPLPFIYPYPNPTKTGEIYTYIYILCPVSTFYLHSSHPNFFIRSTHPGLMTVCRCFDSRFKSKSISQTMFYSHHSMCHLGLAVLYQVCLSSVIPSVRGWRVQHASL